MWWKNRRKKNETENTQASYFQRKSPRSRLVARHSAEAIGLTGWVRNCWDGSVEAEVQGTSEEIGLFLKKIYEARYIQIEDLEAKQLPLKEERGFQVLHG